MKTLLNFILIFTSLALLHSCAISFKASSVKKNSTSETNPKSKPKKNGIKPYSEVITKDAISDDGLFKVHKIEADYYYEIPDSLFEKEMLMVSRISKTASGIGFGGGKQNTQVLRWQKRDKQVLLRVVSYEVFAADSLAVHEAVVNSNFEPVLYTFPIKAYSKDSTATVIDVTDLFKTDVKALGLPSSVSYTHLRAHET